MLLSIVSFDIDLFGTKATTTDQEKCSKIVVPVGEKCNHGKHKLAKKKQEQGSNHKNERENYSIPSLREEIGLMNYALFNISSQGTSLRLEIVQCTISAWGD